MKWLMVLFHTFPSLDWKKILLLLWERQFTHMISNYFLCEMMMSLSFSNFLELFSEECHLQDHLAWVLFSKTKLHFLAVTQLHVIFSIFETEQLALYVFLCWWWTFFLFPKLEMWDVEFLKIQYIFKRMCLSLLQKSVSC